MPYDLELILTIVLFFLGLVLLSEQLDKADQKQAYSKGLGAFAVLMIICCLPLIVHLSMTPA